MRTLAIVGVGLIGGSFALALRKAGFSGRILGVSSPDTIRLALEKGVIDEPATLESACSEADLIYLAQPISGILKSLERIQPFLRPGCLVTDAGSTKAQIVSQAERCLPQSMFLGGHPMAGKESRGVESADADLFRGRPYVLTPTSPEHLTRPDVAPFVQWVTRIGAEPIVLSPTEHDRTVAFTSHLPQLLSTALAETLSENLPDERQNTAGTGLQDTLRLALSSYEIWGDIVSTNTAEIDHALQVYIDKLTVFRQNLWTRGLREDFAVANRTAARIRRLGK